MRWCEENTLNFVKIYLDKECLWNPAHEWYKTKFKRETAYSEIISQFKTLTGKCMTMPEVKIKIKNLRSTYTQEVQKILHKSNPNSMYKPSLIWFHEMDRCLKYVPNTKTSTEYFGQDINEMDTEQAIWSNQDKMFASSFEDESSDLHNPLQYTDNDNETSATQEAVILKLEPESSPEHSNVYIQRRKRKKPKKSHQYVIGSRIENFSKEDEFDIYGKYIASQLRKMDLQSALKLQLEIQNLINEARVSFND